MHIRNRQIGVRVFGQNFEVFTNQPNTLRDAIRLAVKYGYSPYDSSILSSSITL